MSKFKINAMSRDELRAELIQIDNSLFLMEDHFGNTFTNMIALRDAIRLKLEKIKGGE